MLLLAILGVIFAPLQPALSFPTDQPRNRAVCIETTCYSLFWASKRFQGAGKMCEKLGGHLMTVRSTVAAEAISQMLAAGGDPPSPALWIGLGPRQGCADASKRLRGFQWVTGDEQSDYSNWARNSSGGVCEQRCVAALADESWEEKDCAAKTDGFLCEFTYAETCQPVAATPAQPVLYTTPFGIEDDGLLALPPGSRALLPALGLQLLCTVDARGRYARWSREAASAWDCAVERGGCAHACEGARCSCPAGERLGADGRSCEPPPGPCEASPCEHFCVPLGGAFACMCQEGFELGADGRTCRDIDDCARTPDVCEQRCDNVEGSFRCSCFPGYEMVEGKCEDVDECQGVQEPCEHECRNTPGGFECLCDAPYVPDPEQPGKCKLFCNSTDCRAVCTQDLTGTFCFCPEGFVVDNDSSDQPDCVDLDECVWVSCTHDCLNVIGSYQCLCPPGQILQADQVTCQPEDYEGSAATEEPEGSSPSTPVTDVPATPPGMDSFGLGILLGVIVGMLVMIFLIGLVHCLLKKRYAAQRALDYKCQSAEKDVVLRGVVKEKDCPAAAPCTITMK